MINIEQSLSLHKRNERLERLLKSLESYLGELPLDEELEETPSSPNILFVCGVGRSGTSLLLQYLAASNVFAYPSNLISRFYMAPYIGELVQKMLFNSDFDYCNQFSDLRSNIKPISFGSKLGKTDSSLEPNEFWYFWRRFFDFESGAKYSFNRFNSEKTKQFLKELLHWEQSAGKPLTMKAIIASWNIVNLFQILPNASFLIIQRDPVDLMISLLNARFKFWGNIEKWYGLVLPQNLGITANGPLEQVALQVAAFNTLIPKQLQDIPERNYHFVNYEKFCVSPIDLWSHSIMYPFTQNPTQPLSLLDKEYQTLNFKSKRAVPDKNSPHYGVSRNTLHTLYAKFVDQLNEKE